MAGPARRQVTLRARPGFATLAVAFLLAIAGGLYLLAQLAPGAPTLLRDVKETHRRLARIERALTAHGATEGRLPCPAADASGVEGVCAAPDSVAVGLVPHDALGLPPEMARDAWGRMITYAVSVPLTTAGAWGTGTVGTLTLDVGIDATNPAAPARRETDRAWILVSHGANGAGATMPSGQTLAPPSGMGEIANLGHPPDDDPATFRSAPHILDAAIAPAFDDLVRAGRAP